MKSHADTTAIPATQIQPEPPSSRGLLDLLPLELREPIYKDVISTGHTALMRCSKTLFAETADLIFEHGICRLEFASEKPESLYPSEETTAKIQSFEIVVQQEIPESYWYLWYSKSYESYMSRNPFNGDIKPPRLGKSFHLSMPSALCCELIGRMPPATTDPLHHLKGFETVSLQWFSKDGEEDARAREEMRKNNMHPDPGRRRVQFVVSESSRVLKYVYEVAQIRLGEDLGKGEVELHEGCKRLVFHPRQYWARLQASL